MFKYDRGPPLHLRLVGLRSDADQRATSRGRNVSIPPSERATFTRRLPSTGTGNCATVLLWYTVHIASGVRHRLAPVPVLRTVVSCLVASAWRLRPVRAGGAGAGGERVRDQRCVSCVCVVSVWDVGVS